MILALVLIIDEMLRLMRTNLFIATCNCRNSSNVAATQVRAIGCDYSITSKYYSIVLQVENITKNMLDEKITKRHLNTLSENFRSTL